MGDSILDEETGLPHRSEQMMRWIVGLISVFAASVISASATPQEPDTLIDKGVSLPVLGFRFSPDLSKKLYELAIKDDRWIRQTSLWRGYTVVLQIRDGKLFLIAVNLNCNEPKPLLKDVLGFEIPDGGIAADFFTGELYHGFGDSWGYNHSSASGEQTKSIRKYVFEAGVLKAVSEIQTEKPIELMRDRIMKDIEILSETLREVDPNDPFRQEK